MRNHWKYKRQGWKRDTVVGMRQTVTLFALLFSTRAYNPAFQSSGVVFQ